MSTSTGLATRGYIGGPYQWVVAPSSGGGTGDSGYGGGGPLGGATAGSLDLALDPATGDFIDAEDGGFVETSDSRTSVLMQMQSDYLKWWGDPFSGSRIRELLEGEDPTTDQDLRDAALQALQMMVDEGVISQLKVDTDVDPAGRTVVLLNYTDNASGRPVDLAYVPFGG